MSVNKKIFSAALSIGVGTFAAKLIFAAKDLIVAAYFGTSEVVDAFVIAYLLPSLSVSVIAASFSIALIPVYVGVKDKEGDAAARDLLARATGLILAILTLLAALFFVLADHLIPLITHNFSDQKLDLTISMFRILFPVTIFGGFASVIAALMNVKEKFIFPAIAPICVPICVVAALSVLQGESKLHALAWGTAIGTIVQVIALSLTSAGRSLFVIPRWPTIDKNLRLVGAQFVTVVVSSVLMSSSDIVDQVMATSLGTGSVAILSYGGKCVSMMLGVGAMALGSAVFPYFAGMVAKEDWKGIRHTVRVYFRIILLVTVPLTAAIWFLSEPIIRILFERGSFTAADTAATVAVQQAFLLQVPFYVLAIFFVRLISTLKLNHLAVISTVISIVLNITLNYLFMQRMGVAGIALSTSIVYVVASLALGFILWIKLPRA